MTSASLKVRSAFVAAAFALVASGAFAASGPGVPTPIPTTGKMVAFAGPGVPTPVPTTGKMVAFAGPGVPTPVPQTGVVA